MKQLFRLGVLFLLLVLLALSGCSRPPEPPKPFQYHPNVEVAVYYPLEVGNAWTYDLVVFAPDGSVEGRDVLMTRVTDRQGDLVTVETAGRAIQYRVTEQGILKHPSESPLIRHPVVPDSEWPITLAGIQGRGRIESVEGKVLTGSGVFQHCLVIVEEFSNEGIHIRYAYAPHVGLVRMEELFVVDGKTVPHLTATLRIHNVGVSRR